MNWHQISPSRRREGNSGHRDREFRGQYTNYISLPLTQIPWNIPTKPYTPYSQPLDFKV